MLELGECLLWVISRHSLRFVRCPLYPQKRTSELSRVMSALCQKRTSTSSFDQVVGNGNTPGGIVSASALALSR